MSTRKADEVGAAIDRMYLSVPVYPAELDVNDDDVFGLEGKLSGFYPATTPEEIEEDLATVQPWGPVVADQELDADDDGDDDVDEAGDHAGYEVPDASADTTGEPAARPLLRRRSASLPRSSRSLAERILMGLVAANTIVVGAMLLVPDLFLPEQRPVDVLGGREQPAAPGAAAPGRQPPPAVDPSRSVTGTMPAFDEYETAQYWIGRGHYEKAVGILLRYMAAHPALSSLHAQAVHSSLAYCAKRLGDGLRADHHTARVEDLRRLAASPGNLLAEARQAERDGSNGLARQLYARLLLKQDSLRGQGQGQADVDAARIESARIALGDTYRLEADRPAQGGRVVR